MSWKPEYAILMFISTFITYLSGIFICDANEIEDEVKREKRKKLYVFLSFAANLLILFYFKYYNFLGLNLNKLFVKFNFDFSIPQMKYLLPVGISFYTFQALSYTMDVYRGTQKAERHFGLYALFVSFFPQLVAGPIERTTHLLPQFKVKHTFDYDRMKEGLIIMTWGFFKKVVIADRIAVIVNTVYNNPTNYKGFELIIATILFTYQIYCDFSGYSDVAIGCSKIMGYDLMLNFDRPYLSKTIGEFWRRWHISLGTWFKEYLYFSIGGNKGTKVNWFRNIMIVFLVSGLWHGASWTFVIWGAVHGVYQIVGDITKKIRSNLREKLGVVENGALHKGYKITTTFILVAFAWIFFRANSISHAMYIVKNLLKLTSINLNTIVKLGLDKKDLIVGICSLLILLIIDLNNKNYKSVLLVKKLPIVIRWSLYYIVIFFIIIFGYYGDTVAKEFIYFQF